MKGIEKLKSRIGDRRPSQTGPSIVISPTAVPITKGMIIHREGWVWKRSTGSFGRSHWKKRWAILHEQRLQLNVLDSPERNQAFALEGCKVEDCNGDKEKDHVKALTIHGGVELILAFENGLEMKKWTTSLQTASNLLSAAAAKATETSPSKIKEAYSSLVQLLLDTGSDFCVSRSIGSVSHQSDFPLCKDLVALAASEGLLSELLNSFVTEHVVKSSKRATLFRENDFMSKMLGRSFHVTGHVVRRDMLQPHVTALCQSHVNLEVDPSRVGDGTGGEESVAEARRELCAAARKILDTITDRRVAWPALIPVTLAHIYSVVRQRMNQFDKTEGVATILQGDSVYARRSSTGVAVTHATMALQSVTAVLFLWFICPAIVAPEVHDVMFVAPLPQKRRQLVLLSKLLQGVANGVYFGAKEVFMTPLNSFIDSEKDRLSSFVQYLCDQGGTFLQRPVFRQELGAEDSVSLYRDIHSLIAPLASQISTKLLAGDSKQSPLAPRVGEVLADLPDLPVASTAVPEVSSKPEISDGEFNTMFGCKGESLRAVFSATLSRRVNIAGKMYVTKNFVIFSGTMFGVKVVEKFMLKDIISVSRGMVQHSVSFQCAGDRHIEFTITQDHAAALAVLLQAHKAKQNAPVTRQSRAFTTPNAASLQSQPTICADHTSEETVARASLTRSPHTSRHPSLPGDTYSPVAESRSSSASEISSKSPSTSLTAISLPAPALPPNGAENLSPTHAADSCECEVVEEEREGEGEGEDRFDSNDLSDTTDSGAASLTPRGSVQGSGSFSQHQSQDPNSPLTYDDWNIILESAESVDYQDGETILRCNTKALGLYQVGSGRVRVVSADGDFLTELEVGEMFGEMSFLGEALASASIEAIGNVTINILLGSTVQKLIELNPTLGQRFYQYLAISLANRLRANRRPPGTPTGGGASAETEAKLREKEEELAASRAECVALRRDLAELTESLERERETSLKLAADLEWEKSTVAQLQLQIEKEKNRQSIPRTASVTPPTNRAAALLQSGGGDSPWGFTESPVAPMTSPKVSSSSKPAAASTPTLDALRSQWLAVSSPKSADPSTPSTPSSRPISQEFRGSTESLTPKSRPGSQDLRGLGGDTLAARIAIFNRPQ